MEPASAEIYMHRCLELARLGQGYVAPNPMVGAVLVHGELIIGEGYHRQYGEAHAEVNCIRSVKPEHLERIPESTLYVSLEPCAHFGKTPPCADLIIEKKIPRVVIGCRDPFVQVNGKGIEKLEAAGVQVITGVLEDACRQLNKRFFTFHTQHRPYILLKWAQTADGKIANEDYSRILISHPQTNRMVHRWRSEEMAILVGTNTAFFDDPSLTTRLWPGRNPIRMVVDMDLRLSPSLRLFDGTVPTIIFNSKKHSLESLGAPPEKGVHYYQVTEDVSLVQQIAHALYRLNIQSVMVEGGSYLLQSFIDEAIWDEARLIINNHLFAGKGLPAPVLNGCRKLRSEDVGADSIHIFQPVNPD